MQIVKAVVLLLVLALTISPSALAQEAQPLVLAEQGSFYVGGTVEFRDPNSTTPGDARFVPGDIAVDHMYV
jgi:hypothetical protein